MASRKAPRKPRATTDALEILDRRYIRGRPKMEALLAAARINLTVGQQIYDLRTKAGLTQMQLADLVGTSHSVISRLEDADYEGHSLTMLQRISVALRYDLQVRFVPRAGRRKATA